MKLGQLQSYVCAGVVKGTTIIPKCPAQRAADPIMLSEQAEFKTVFFDREKCPKTMDCIRVDGGSDGGPPHLEVQYWWSESHLLESKHSPLLHRGRS